MEAGPCPGAEWIIIRELNEIILKNEKEIKREKKGGKKKKKFWGFGN